MLHSLVHIQRVPEDDRIHHQTKRPKLVFLPFLISSSKARISSDSSLMRGSWLAKRMTP
jgi:hypothetical protein